MRFNRAELAEFLHIAVEALGRYKLRTMLSVLGIVLGIAAVIAMMSVSEGARREALDQVEALGLDNLVARNQGSGAYPGASSGLTALDADLIPELVPLTHATSPLIDRYLRLTRDETTTTAPVLGVRASYADILHLTVDRGRFLSTVDEETVAPVCVLGAMLSRTLFGYRDPLGEHIRIDQDYYQVVGVLSSQGAALQRPGTLAWRDMNEVAIVPLPVLSGVTLDVAPHQSIDELWVRVSEGERADELSQIFGHALERLHGGRDGFNIVVPRELLAQRNRTQRTFSIVIGSVAALSLLVGGIGVMNIMLTSVVERTHEIGVRRTVGATRRDVTLQFLIETLLMTVCGGALGIVTGVIVSSGITAYAGWSTHVSPSSVALGVSVSVIVGLTFGIYPAVKAAHLEPVDALRHE